MPTKQRRGSACTEREPLRNQRLPDHHNSNVSDDDMLRCDIWVQCENPFCFQHGCRNIIQKRAKNASKAVKS